MQKKKILGAQGRERGPRHKPENLSHKIEPLQGSVSVQYVRCGRSNCKCAKGQLHGPYYVRFWREFGGRRRKYVKKGDLDRILKGCEARKENQREMRNLVKEINQAGKPILRMIREMLREYKI